MYLHDLSSNPENPGILARLECVEGWLVGT